MQQRWVARWTTPHGTPREFYFYSPDDLVIARTVFRLELIEKGLPHPNEYELEPAREGLPALPLPVQPGGYL